jgi:hypothetical protein
VIGIKNGAALSGRPVFGVRGMFVSSAVKDRYGG